MDKISIKEGEFVSFKTNQFKKVSVAGVTVKNIPTHKIIPPV